MLLSGRQLLERFTKELSQILEAWTVSTIRSDIIVMACLANRQIGSPFHNTKLNLDAMSRDWTLILLK